MDIALNIIQVIKQNARIHHVQLNEDQNNRLAQIFPNNFNYEQFKSDFIEIFDLWKRETLLEVGSRIGDLRKEDLGDLLNMNTETFKNDVLNLPTFQLVDNDNSTDNDLLNEYEVLRKSIISRCHLIEYLRAYTCHDPEIQLIDSIFTSTNFSSWTNEVTSELKHLIQTMEGLLKSWPTLTKEQRDSAINVTRQVSKWLEDIIASKI